MTFLVIEDDASIARLIQTVVESIGHHCLSAATTPEADLVLATIPVDGMTLDLGLPKSKPVWWLEEIALTRPELAENTIVITGKVPSEEDEARIRKCGAGMLLKPFTLPQLNAMISDRIIQRDAIRRRRNAPELPADRTVDLNERDPEEQV